MKKRILALVLAMACVFSLAACGSSATDDASAAPAEATEEAAVEEEPAVDPTSEEAYIAYLHEFVDECSAISENQRSEFYACADALDFETFPGDMFFSGMLGASAMTYDEFVAAGGEYTIPDEIKAATADAAAE